MANTIKLKRASSSDPGASDLSVGELAIRTSNCKLFSKMMVDRLLVLLQVLLMF